MEVVVEKMKEEIYPLCSLLNFRVEEGMVKASTYSGKDAQTIIIDKTDFDRYRVPKDIREAYKNHWNNRKGTLRRKWETQEQIPQDTISW